MRKLYLLGCFLTLALYGGILAYAYAILGPSPILFIVLLLTIQPLLSLFRP
jgi:hypothetical protein